jgi:hypothetical protein
MSTHQAVTGRAISKQTFNISPKIREVDLLMTAALQDRVYEVHPECFHALNGSPLSHGKKKPEGVSPNAGAAATGASRLTQAPGIPGTSGRAVAQTITSTPQLRPGRRSVSRVDRHSVFLTNQEGRTRSANGDLVPEVLNADADG